MPGARIRIAGLLVLTLAAMPAPAQARIVVDRIVMRGSADVATRVLAARMHLYSGDTLDFSVLRAAEQRLVESDLFSRVRVFIDLPTAEAVRRMFLDDTTHPVEVVVEAVGKQSWFVFPTARLAVAIGPAASSMQTRICLVATCSSSVRGKLASLAATPLWGTAPPSSLALL